MAGYHEWGWVIIVVLVVLPFSLCIRFALWGFNFFSHTPVAFMTTPLSFCIKASIFLVVP